MSASLATVAPTATYTPALTSPSSSAYPTIDESTLASVRYCRVPYNANVTLACCTSGSTGTVDGDIVLVNGATYAQGQVEGTLNTTGAYPVCLTTADIGSWSSCVAAQGSKLAQQGYAFSECKEIKVPKNSGDGASLASAAPRSALLRRGVVLALAMAAAVVVL